MDLQPPPQTADAKELQMWGNDLWRWLRNLHFNRNLVGSAAWNPGSIAAGGYEEKDVTITGAALGDFAVASFSIDIAGLVLTATVTAADTVTCALTNSSAGAIDLAAGTVYALVIKKTN